jgi:hypothetical protein
MIGLIAVGVAILNANSLGVTDDGKILLKSAHVWIGYVFAVNLLWRLVWAFIGGTYARWQSILPGGRGYLSAVRGYIADFSTGHPRQYIGHNPLGRIAVTLLLFLLLVQAVTGLVLAGTDLFYPPIGSWIAGWVAGPGIDPATLVPYSSVLSILPACAAAQRIKPVRHDTSVVLSHRRWRELHRADDSLLGQSACRLDGCDAVRESDTQA